MAGFNAILGVRRFICDLKKNKLTVLEEEGFLEEKSFMDLKQISETKVVAVTYDAHYYIIQYEGQETDYSVLINKEPIVGQSQNWASTIQLIPGFNLDYFPFAIAKEYRALVLINLREKTKERIVKLTS